MAIGWRCVGYGDASGNVAMAKANELAYSDNPPPWANRSSPGLMTYQEATLTAKLMKARLPRSGEGAKKAALVIDSRKQWCVTSTQQQHGWRETTQVATQALLAIGKMLGLMNDGQISDAKLANRILRAVEEMSEVARRTATEAAGLRIRMYECASALGLSRVEPSKETLDDRLMLANKVVEATRKIMSPPEPVSPCPECGSSNTHRSNMTGGRYCANCRAGLPLRGEDRRGDLDAARAIAGIDPPVEVRCEGDHTGEGHTP